MERPYRGQDHNWKQYGFLMVKPFSRPPRRDPGAAARRPERATACGKRHPADVTPEPIGQAPGSQQVSAPDPDGKSAHQNPFSRRRAQKTLVIEFTRPGVSRAKLAKECRAGRLSLLDSAPLTPISRCEETPSEVGATAEKWFTITRRATPRSPTGWQGEWRRGVSGPFSL